jgi:hypothetical protein
LSKLVVAVISNTSKIEILLLLSIIEKWRDCFHPVLAELREMGADGVGYTGFE